MNPVITTPFYLCKVHFNIILPPISSVFKICLLKLCFAAYDIANTLHGNIPNRSGVGTEVTHSILDQIVFLNISSRAPGYHNRLLADPCLLICYHPPTLADGIRETNLISQY
jgi:hypothetical protein